MDKWRKKRQVMKRYDLTAHLYDMRYEVEQRAKHKAALKNLKSEELGLVLDAGCGTGLLFSDIAALAKTVVGVDLSKKSLLLAQQRTKTIPNARLVLADVDHLPFEQGIFSHVFAMTLLQNSPNSQETLCEIGRVAQSNATVAVTGLKRVSSLDDFKKLLRKAGLRLVALELEGLRCYVAVCAKLPSKSRKA